MGHVFYDQVILRLLWDGREELDRGVELTRVGHMSNLAKEAMAHVTVCFFDWHVSSGSALSRSWHDMLLASGLFHVASSVIVLLLWRREVSPPCSSIGKTALGSTSLQAHCASAVPAVEACP